MSKKKRPKKKYNARTLAIPAYLSTLDPDLGKPDSVARFKDQTFLMKIANQTASIEDVFVQQQVFQTAWILAERMDSTEAIRRALSEGMRALATYMVKDPQTEVEDHFDCLCTTVDLCREVLETSGEVERLLALDAVLTGKVKMPHCAFKA